MASAALAADGAVPRNRRVWGAGALGPGPLLRAALLLFVAAPLAARFTWWQRSALPRRRHELAGEMEALEW